MALTLPADDEAIAVSFFKAQTDINALVGGRVATSLNATLPALRVGRIGGTPPDTYEDQPVLQIEAWDATRTGAKLLIRSVVAALPSMRGTYTSGRVYTFQVDSGPYYFPDDPNLSTNHRYLVTVRLITTP